MKHLVGVVAALFLACGHATRADACVAYGVELKAHGEPGWSCSQFKDYMSTIREVFDRYGNDERWKAKNFDRQLEGYTVEINSESAWYSEEHGYWISGWCDCTQYRTRISYYPFGLALGAEKSGDTLAHELSHALESCYYGPASDGEESDRSHSKWGPRGIYELIKLAHETQITKDWVACDQGVADFSCPK